MELWEDSRRALGETRENCGRPRALEDGGRTQRERTLDFKIWWSRRKLWKSQARAMSRGYSCPIRSLFELSYSNMALDECKYSNIVCSYCFVNRLTPLPFRWPEERPTWPSQLDISPVHIKSATKEKHKNDQNDQNDAVPI